MKKKFNEGNQIDIFIICLSELLSFHLNSDPLRQKVPDPTGSGSTTLRRTHLASLVRVVAASPHTRSLNPQVVSKYREKTGELLKGTVA